MSADVAGYTSMMAKNDVLTLRALLECIERIAALVRAFNGRVVDSVGDNLLAEFPSERAALCCANEVQLMLLERNRDCDPAERMEFRIGLSSGSLLSTEDRLFGDVVNLAARMQSSALPGGILMSESVAGGVGRSLADGLIGRGLQYFKNIPYAVRTFEVPVRRAAGCS
jgi:class 3 adenylate cyclase